MGGRAGRAGALAGGDDGVAGVAQDVPPLRGAGPGERPEPAEHVPAGQDAQPLLGAVAGRERGVFSAGSWRNSL